MEDHPTDQARRPLSLKDVIEKLRAFSRDELFHWLARALDESSPEAIPLPMTWERHAFLANLYRSCDHPLQLRFSDAFAGLLEQFEQRPGPAPEDRQYLFSLLSLASTVRSDRAKVRLRRWLYLELFHDWKQEFFNLHGELILATTAYDPDEAWVEYISKVLPTRPFFREVARQAYRALLQTRGLDCLTLLPDVLKVLDPLAEEDKEQFGYLLSITLNRHGREIFLRQAKAALSGSHLGVSDVLASVLAFEDFLAEPLRETGDHFEEFIQRLNSEVWSPATRRWQEMEAQENLQAFEEILEKCDYTIIPQGYIKDALGVLTFNGGKHELIVPHHCHHLKAFFKHYEVNYEEANKPLAARAAGA
jgi:hypothetical protein